MAMLINCNGIKGTKNKIKFQAAISHHKPDIIFGCESKLDENTASYSVFSEEYEVYRKDRTVNGGGVFLAVRNGIIAINRHEYDSKAEICWVSLESVRNRCLYIGSYYRPYNATRAALEHLQNSLDKIIARHSKLPNIVQ